MAIKTPIKATFSGANVVGLAEFTSSDFIGVAAGGIGTTSLTSNSILLGNGTDAVQSSSIQIVGTTLSSSDSSTININEGLVVEGNLNVTGTITGTIAASNITNANINFTDDSSTVSTVPLGSTLKIAGGSGVDTAISGDTITISLESTVVTETSTDTLTNKTISGSDNTLTNISNSSLTNSSITIADNSSSTTTISLGETLKVSGTSNEIETTISGDTITIGLPNDVTIAGNLTVNGTTTTVNSTTIEITNSFTFEGSTANDFETTLGVIDPTADRTINLPNASGTVITTGNLSAITGLDATSIADGSISNTEFQYLNGVSSNIQTQLDSKASRSFAIAQAVALG